MREKRAPETKPSPLRQGAGSRRSRSVDLASPRWRRPGEQSASRRRPSTIRTARALGRRSDGAAVDGSTSEAIVNSARGSALSNLTSGHPPELEGRRSRGPDRVLRCELAERFVVDGLHHREPVGVLIGENGPNTTMSPRSRYGLQWAAWRLMISRSAPSAFERRLNCRARGCGLGTGRRRRSATTSCSAASPLATEHAHGKANRGSDGGCLSAGARCAVTNAGAAGRSASVSFTPFR
jgi:hypothetical protein